MNLYTQLKYGYGVERVACLPCLAYICMSSQVSSWGKAHWRPGDGTFRVCVSARLPGAGGASQGLWPAHWLMPMDKTCDPDEGEMDIMEVRASVHG